MKFVKKNTPLASGLFLLFFIFLYTWEIPKKFYNILTVNYNSRISKIYGFCSDRSSGFILYIIKKYQLSKVPKIIKYTGVRNPYWIIFKRKLYDSNNLILIKYNSDQVIHLGKEGNSYVYNFSYRNNHKKIKKIVINNFKENDAIDTVQLFMGGKKMYDLKIKDTNILFSNNNLSIDLPLQFSAILYNHKFDDQNFFFKFKSKKNLFIDNIYPSLLAENEIDLNNFIVKEQFDDCYYLVKK